MAETESRRPASGHVGLHSECPVLVKDVREPAQGNEPSVPLEHMIDGVPGSGLVGVVVAAHEAIARLLLAIDGKRPALPGILGGDLCEVVRSLEVANLFDTLPTEEQARVVNQRG